MRYCSRFRAAGIGVAILGILLPACQSYVPKPLDPVAIADGIVTRDPLSSEFQRYLQSQGYDATQLPVRQWGLKEFIHSALFHHPDLDVARAQWRAAQAAEMTAAGRPNPGISTNTEKHRQHEDHISPWTYGLSIDIPVETAGKRGARMERASKLSEAARIEIAQEAWEVRSRVHDSWLAWQHGRQYVSLLHEEQKLRSDIVSMLESRFREGMISSLELAIARLQLQKVQHSLDTETARLGELKATLANHAGLTLQALEKLDLQDADLTEIPSVPIADSADTHAQLRAGALLNRLDVRAALARYDAAEARLKLEIARQYPDLEISPGYIYDQGDRIRTLGLSTLLALFNRNEGNIAEAEAERELEAARIRELQSNIIGELEIRGAAYQQALTSLNETRRMMEAQQERVHRMARQLEQGFADRLEMAGVELEILQTKYSLLNNGLRLRQAARALEDALQQPLETALDMPEDYRLQAVVRE